MHLSLHVLNGACRNECAAKQCYKLGFHMHIGIWQAQDSYAVLDTVPYGRQGPFAINLWFKVDDIFGDSYAYLYSHESSSPSDFGPNQVGPCLRAHHEEVIRGESQ